MNTAHVLAHRPSQPVARPRLQLVSPPPAPTSPPRSAQVAALLGGLTSGFVLAGGAAAFVGADASGELTAAAVLGGLMCVALVRARLTVRRTSRRRAAVRGASTRATSLAPVTPLRHAA